MFYREGLAPLWWLACFLLPFFSSTYRREYIAGAVQISVRLIDPGGCIAGGILLMRNMALMKEWTQDIWEPWTGPFLSDRARFSSLSVGWGTCEGNIRFYPFSNLNINLMLRFPWKLSAQYFKSTCAQPICTLGQALVLRYGNMVTTHSSTPPTIPTLLGLDRLDRWN